VVPEDQTRRAEEHEVYNDLKGKTALVTGSGQGIGRGIALALAAEGVDVAVNVRKSIDAGEETVEAARRAGVRSSVHQADIADREAVFAMVDSVLEEFGKIDILVNNAGSAAPRGRSFEDVEIDAFRRHIDEGLHGTVHCCQAVGRHMVQRLTGSVINITSISARRPLPFWGGYSVAKQAVTMLTRELALEWLQPEGSTIRVNAIAPGLIATPRTARLVENPELMRPRLEGIPMRRAGTVEDIAHVALFLASDCSGYMTGQELVVDGGESDYWPEMARWGRA
jgi:glucose 1-dehydrogenase